MGTADGARRDGKGGITVGPEAGEIRVTRPQLGHGESVGSRRIKGWIGTLVFVIRAPVDTAIGGAIGSVARR